MAFGVYGVTVQRGYDDLIYWWRVLHKTYAKVFRNIMKKLISQSRDWKQAQTGLHIGSA